MRDGTAELPNDTRDLRLSRLKMARLRRLLRRHAAQAPARAAARHRCVTGHAGPLVPGQGVLQASTPPSADGEDLRQDPGGVTSAVCCSTPGISGDGARGARGTLSSGGPRLANGNDGGEELLETANVWPMDSGPLGHIIAQRGAPTRCGNTWRPRRE